eukprot:15476391-Alexandrium_andersonii.AAC.1
MTQSGSPDFAARAELMGTRLLAGLFTLWQQVGRCGYQRVGIAGLGCPGWVGGAGASGPGRAGPLLGRPARW